VSLKIGNKAHLMTVCDVCNTDDTFLQMQIILCTLSYNIEACHYEMFVCVCSKENVYENVACCCDLRLT